MNSTESRYWNLIRFLLSFIGLSPCKSTLVSRIRLTFSFGSLLSFFIAQLLNFATAEYSWDIFLDLLSHIVSGLVFIIKYLSFGLNIRKVKEIVELIQIDWNDLKGVDEFLILRDTLTGGGFLVMALTIFIYGTLLIFVLSLFGSDILNVLVPLNESRPRRLPLPLEYFVDEDKYFYLIALHVSVAFVIGANTLVATESALVIFIHHVYALFRITSYRMRNALRDDSLSFALFSNDLVVCERIVDAVEMHKRAIECFERIACTFTMSYAVVLMLCVGSLSINLFRLSQLLLKGDTEEVILCTIFVMTHFLYMFYMNYMGQKVIDYSGEIFHKAYDSEWYLAPIFARKFLLFIMQRSFRTCNIVTGGVFILSYEGFMTFISTSVSFFTVIYSVQ